MIIVILILGIIIGFFLNSIIVKVLRRISGKTSLRGNIPPIIAYALCFTISYLILGLGPNFLRAAVLAGLLTIVSFVDLHTRIIPDYMVLIILAAGIIFSLFGCIPILDSLLGMVIGGGIFLILGLVPNALGGGDIKLMFALGAYLGLRNTLSAIVLAFIASSVISIVLLLFKLYGRKDHISFGPFLSLGSFISLMFFI